MELLKGQTLGDYAVLKEIGHGGVGRVYEVEHTITRRREAIKVMSFEGVGETERSERFLREIRLQAALNHPNIAAVHNAFWTDDNFILVSELLEGESLQAVLARGKLSVQRSLEIIRQVLAALRCAHTRGIMHRDISPANIFVTSAGAVKLIDFGLAKASTDLNLTQAGLAVGSFYYTSPEQIRAEPAVDIRTDLYSCGAVLFEMLTGQKPFEGTAYEVMQAHCELAPKSPCSIDAQIPQALSEVVMTSLSKRPDDRYGSAEEFLRTLEGIAVVAEAKPTPKKKVGLLALAASAVLAIGVGFVILRSMPRAIAVTPGPVVAAPVNVAPTTVDPMTVAPVQAAPVVAEIAKPVSKPSAKKATVAAVVPVAAAPVVDDDDKASAATEEAVAGPVVETVATDAVAAQAPEPQPTSHGVMGTVKKLNPFHKKRAQ